MSFDDVLLAACDDPDALLDPLYDLLEVLPLETDNLVSLATLDEVLKRWYYCPSVADLVLRAMNLVLHKDRSLLEAHVFPSELVDILLFVACNEGTNDDDTLDSFMDTTASQVLDWCIHVASTIPTKLLSTGTLFMFLQNRNGRRRAMDLALLLLRYADFHDANQVAALVACAPLIAHLTGDPDSDVADAALSWTIFFVRDIVPLAKNANINPHPAVAAIEAQWRGCFHLASADTQATLVQCVETLVPFGIHPDWLHLATASLSSPQVWTLSTSPYPVRDAAIYLLDAIAQLGCQVEPLNAQPPDGPRPWTCPLCTFHDNHSSSSTCVACDSPREGSALDHIKQSWRELLRDVQNQTTEVRLQPMALPPDAIEPALYSVLRFVATINVLPTGARLLARCIDATNAMHLTHLADVLDIMARHLHLADDAKAVVEAFHPPPESAAAWNALLRQFKLPIIPTHALDNDPHKSADVHDGVQAELPMSADQLKSSDMQAPREWDLQWAHILSPRLHDDLFEPLLRCRVHGVGGGFVDCLVHPMVRVTQLLHALAQVQLATIDGSTERKKSPSNNDEVDLPFNATIEVPLDSPWPATTNAKNLNTNGDDQRDRCQLAGVADGGSRVTGGGILLSGGDAMCKPWLVRAKPPGEAPMAFYITSEIADVVTPPRPSTEDAHRTDGAGAVYLPRFTWCVWEEMQLETAQLAKALPSTFMDCLMANPTAVPLTVRAAFFFGHHSTRIVREGVGGRLNVQVTRGNSDLTTSGLAVLDAPPHKVVYVTFAGESGHGVGPTTEFYTAMGQSFGRASLGLWRSDGGVDDGVFVDSRRGWYPSSRAMSARHLNTFELFGQFLARASLDGYPLSVNLSVPFLKALQGKDLTWADLEDVDRVFFGGIAQLPTHSADVLAAMELYFTVPGDQDAVLCEDGDHRQVTAANVAEFVGLAQSHFLHKCLRVQASAVLRGVDAVSSRVIFQCFTPDELQRVMGPTNDEAWTKETIVAHVKCSGNGYSWSSDVMLWLADRMAVMDRTERRRFLQFVTGAPTLPIGGWADLGLSVARVANRDALPSASTCQHLLKLPHYESANELETKLLLAMTEGQAYFAFD